MDFSNTCYKVRVPKPDLEAVRNNVVYIVYIDGYIYLCHMILIFHLGWLSQVSLIFFLIDIKQKQIGLTIQKQYSFKVIPGPPVPSGPNCEGGF